MKSRWRWTAAIAAALVLGVLLARRDLPPSIPADAGAAGRAAQPHAATAAPRAARAGRADTTPPDQTKDPAFEQCNRDYQQAVRTRMRELAAGTPRDRIAAALWRQTLPDGYSDQTRAEIVAAMAQAADDPLALGLHAMLCDSRDGCDAGAAIERSLQADPDNLASWLQAISVAVRRGDEEQGEALLQRAARTTHIDLRWGEAALLMKTSLGPVAPTQACRDAADAIGELLNPGRAGTPDDLATVAATVSAPLPTLHGITKMCPFRDAIPVRRLGACRAVLARMGESDELIPHLAGVRAMTVLAATAAERAQWRERLRNSAWLSSQAAAVMRAEHLPLAWEKGEVAVYIALLEEAGRWPAPKGWLPADPETRAMIRGAAP
jgi:hypothetical protein